MVKRLCCKLIHHGMMMRIIETLLLRGKGGIPQSQISLAGGSLTQYSHIYLEEGLKLKKPLNKGMVRAVLVLSINLNSNEMPKSFLYCRDDPLVVLGTSYPQ
jgi:hypothetical protein